MLHLNNGGWIPHFLLLSLLCNNLQSRPPHPLLFAEIASTKFPRDLHFIKSISTCIRGGLTSLEFLSSLGFLGYLSSFVLLRFQLFIFSSWHLLVGLRNGSSLRVLGFLLFSLYSQVLGISNQDHSFSYHKDMD